MTDGLWSAPRQILGTVCPDVGFLSQNDTGTIVMVWPDGEVSICGPSCPATADAILACLAAARGQQTKEGK